MLRAPLAAICLLFVATTSARECSAAIIFNITYQDVVVSNGLGFDDPILGATRRATIASVTDYLNTVLNHNGTIDMRILASQTDGTGFLASSGPFFFVSPPGFRNGFAFDHATTGIDPYNPMDGFPDAEATFDFGRTWNSGTGAPGGDEYDLFSVALHEFSHSLGFMSLVSAAGVSAFDPPFNTDPGVFTVFDSFLELGDGTALFGAGGDFLGTSADLISNDVFFDGPNARAANGGNPVPIYAPGAFAPGSSMSHITLSNAVMQFSIGPGVQRRAYSAQELGILADIGWSLQTTAVPEPGGMLLAGMAGGIGILFKRRRRKSRAPSTTASA